MISFMNNSSPDYIRTITLMVGLTYRVNEQWLSSQASGLLGSGTDGTSSSSFCNFSTKAVCPWSWNNMERDRPFFEWKEVTETLQIMLANSIQKVLLYLALNEILKFHDRGFMKGPNCKWWTKKSLKPPGNVFANMMSHQNPLKWTFRSRCGSLNQWDVMSFISVLIQPKPTVDGSELRLTTNWDVSQTLDKIILKKTSNLNMVETAGFRTNHQHLRVEMRSALNTAFGLYFCEAPMINTGTWRTQIITICFRKWWYPQNTPKWSFLVGKPMVVGYHHFRKPPYRRSLISWGHVEWFESWMF